MGDNKVNSVHLNIPFSKNEHAVIAYDVMSVDEELKKSGIKRNIDINGLNLIVEFEGADLRKLRTSVNAFIKNISLIVKTFECFR